MEQVVLLGFWTSPYVMRVKIALLEKGVQFHYEEEKDIFENQLLKANPIHKKVPVLIHNGRSICESLIILEYIDEVWKQEKQLFFLITLTTEPKPGFGSICLTRRLLFILSHIPSSLFIYDLGEFSRLSLNFVGFTFFLFHNFWLF